MHKKADKHIEELLKSKARRLSINEGSAFSVSDGMGLRYITPFAIAMGASNEHIGILNSLPQMVGSFSELYSAKIMKKFSRKTVVSFFVFLQALMWLLIIGIGAMFFVYGLDHSLAPTLLILAFTLLIGVGMFANPIWASWIKDIIPEKCGNYFGVRNRTLGIVALASMLVAGYILDFYKSKNLFLGFSILFIISFFGRTISAYIFTKMYEPKMVTFRKHKIGFIDFIKGIPNHNFGKFTLYTSFLSFAVSIASPFFTVYMLENLKFSYLYFTAVIMISQVVRLLVMPAWGKFSDIYGNLKVMKITSLLIPLVPLLWLLSPFVINNNPSLILLYLLVVESFSGFVWAGFDLCSSDFIYDAVNPERIATFTAYFTILNNIAFFIGAIIGGYLASIKADILGLNPILFIFLLSGVARIISAMGLSTKVLEVRKVRNFDADEARIQFMHLSPHRIIRILK